MFELSRCIIKDSTLDKIILIAKRCDNTYVLYLDDLFDQNVKCLAFFVDEKWMWHKKLGYAHMRLISMISQKELVKGLPKMNFDNDSICKFYQKGKQTKSSFHNKNVVSTTRPHKLFILIFLDQVELPVWVVRDMVQSLCITFLSTHELYSLPIRMKLVRPLKCCQREFNM